MDALDRIFEELIDRGPLNVGEMTADVSRWSARRDEERLMMSLSMSEPRFGRKASPYGPRRTQLLVGNGIGLG